MRFGICAFLVIAVGLSLGVVPALAQSQLDVPRVSVGAASRVSVELDVAAGASGVPAGFVVEWMKQSDYDMMGWPADAETNPLVQRASFTGTPTLNISTGSYVLDPDGSVQVVLGNLFDETGVAASDVSELASGQQYVIRVRAIGTPDAVASDYSATQAAATQSLPIANCTYTVGFWKNHASQWPVGSLTLGTVTYTAAQLLDILNTPAGGNGLISLAHQLIAAKLNIMNGADPTPIASVIADADGLIDGLVVPPVGSGFLDPAVTSTDTGALTDYNEGLLGVPHCGAVAARAATWGTLKATYR